MPSSASPTIQSLTSWLVVLSATLVSTRLKSLPTVCLLLKDHLSFVQCVHVPLLPLVGFGFCDGKIGGLFIYLTM